MLVRPFGNGRLIAGEKSQSCANAMNIRSRLAVQVIAEIQSEPFLNSGTQCDNNVNRPACFDFHEEVVIFGLGLAIRRDVKVLSFDSNSLFREVSKGFFFRQIRRYNPERSALIGDLSFEKIFQIRDSGYLI